MRVAQVLVIEFDSRHRQMVRVADQQGDKAEPRCGTSFGSAAVTISSSPFGSVTVLAVRPLSRFAVYVYARIIPHEPP